MGSPRLSSLHQGHVPVIKRIVCGWEKAPLAEFSPLLLEQRTTVPGRRQRPHHSHVGLTCYSTVTLMAVLQRLNQAAGRVGVLSSSLPAASQVAQVLQSVQPSRDAEQPCWVFLGPPGVGKGTYSGRIAEAMGVPHISAGDLVRNEIGLQSSVGLQVSHVRTLCERETTSMSLPLVGRHMSAQGTSFHLRQSLFLASISSCHARH